VTDHLISELEAADGLETMTGFYRPKYEEGAFGNKILLAHLTQLKSEGITFIEGTVSEHVDAEEHVNTNGQRVMVVSSEWEEAISWKGPWDDVKWGTPLMPTDFDLPLVELQTPVVV